jgi:hypothetical protein
MVGYCLQYYGAIGFCARQGNLLGSAPISGHEVDRRLGPALEGLLSAGRETYTFFLCTMALRLHCSTRDRPVSCRTLTSARKQVVGFAYPLDKPSLAACPMPLRALNQFTKMIEGRSGGLFRPLAARLWTTGQAAHAVEAPSAPSTGLHTLEVSPYDVTCFNYKSDTGCR